MNGIFLIDKEVGMTSYDVIRKLKKKFHVKKIGHAGTLDPFATGLLVILLGHATKLSSYFLTSEKSYKTTIEFGKKTTSYDHTGVVIESNDEVITLDDIKRVLPKMTHYQQEPPMVSALKVNGKKLYELARQGIEIEREKRDVHIFKQDIMSYKFPYLDLLLSVSKGTYIRSYAMDLAAHLNTVAMLKSLRRVQSGSFHVQNAKVLEDISIEDLIPIEEILDAYPKIQVSDYIADKVKHGILLDQRQYHMQEPFRVYNQSNQMIAFYEPIGQNQYKIVFYNGES